MSLSLRILRILLFFLLSWPAAANERQSPPLALAKAYGGAVPVSRYWVSEKLDGVRAWWDGAAFLSRGGKRLQAPSWFIAGFPQQPLDGELWLGRGAFAELSGIVRRTKSDGAAWRKVRFMVFDLPAHPGVFDERLLRLGELFDGVESPYIGLVEQFRVADEDELMAQLNRVVAAGGEGLMLRRGLSRYRAGRTNDLLKLKLHQDAEAVVLAHLPGKGKYAGMLGALLVEMPDGTRFRLGTGFSDAERRDPPPVGATVTYKHYGVTSNGLPRFASFLRLREGI